VSTLTSTTTDLHHLSGIDIARAVQRGLYSARDVTEYFIARVVALNPRLKAITHLDLDYWRSQAEAVDSRADKGVLAGVPVGIKDIMNTEVLPTEMGSAIWQGHKAGNDARCVSYIRRDGGIVAGKTDTAEFAVHTPNAVVNPWSAQHVTGTSSGGSAVAVAAGMLPMALGTQTAGSTIRPGSWCGVYAMKPSFGLIPRTGVLKTTDTLDNIGFFARSVRDLSVLLDILRAKGDNYPGRDVHLATLGQPPAGRTWRVGFVRGHLWDQAPAYVHGAMEAFARTLDSLPHVEVVDVALPASATQAHALHRRIYNPCLAYYFRDELQKAPERISAMFMRLVEDGRSVPPEDYKAALEEQAALSHDIDPLFGTVDVLLHYSSNGSAPKGSEPELNMDLNLLWTLAWLPVINVPCFTCPAKLPFGLQVIGPRYGDYRLFAFIRHMLESELVPQTAVQAVV